MYPDIISTTVVPLRRTDFLAMLRLVRLLDRLSRSSLYRDLVAPLVPDVARFDPGHDAVMMCYDFHLTDTGPMLIEVNTNAGGGLPAYLAARQLSQTAPRDLPDRLKQKLLAQFFQEYRQFSAGQKSALKRIAILDEAPEQQFLYREMRFFAELFESAGISADVVDPDGLEASAEGAFLDQTPIDLVYNRHCDFYLDTPEMSGVRDAYLARHVCLTPNPFIYGLLADKRRLTLWSENDFAERVGLTEEEARLLGRMIPKSRLLLDQERDTAWAERRHSVFKPVARFGSRGVLVGEKMSRKRFEQLDPATTLVQEFVPPSLTEVTGGGTMKTDFRVFAYRNRALGVTARLYRGQVTNLRTEGGGFAGVRVTRDAS